MAIMDKLGLRTTAELTRYALEHGITREKEFTIPWRISTPRKAFQRQSSFWQRAANQPNALSFSSENFPPFVRLTTR